MPDVKCIRCIEGKECSCVGQDCCQDGRCCTPDDGCTGAPCEPCCNNGSCCTPDGGCGCPCDCSKIKCCKK